MRVVIVDLEWYNKVSFSPNIMCMKLSSYYQQMGHLVTLAQDEYDLRLDFDEMYVIRKSIGGSLPPQIKIRDQRVHLMGPGFKFYDRYLAELPEVVAACRPDYLLYPVKEENQIGNADVVQFYSKGKRIELMQDYTNAYKKAKNVYVVDEDFWDKDADDIKACVEILQKNGNKNVVFQKPISLKRIVFDPEVRQLFVTTNFMRNSLIIFNNDTDAKDYRVVLDFLLDFAKNHENHYPAVHFAPLTFDHNKYPERVIDEIERCIKMVVEGKKMGIRIYIDSPARKDTPFWYYFETIEYWCKYYPKKSFVETMLTSAAIVHRTTTYNIMMTKMLWSTVTAEMLKDLYRKRPEMIDNYGWVEWEDVSFPYHNLKEILGGK